MNNPENKNNYNTIEFLIPPEAKGGRIDKYIGNSKEIDLTRNKAQKILDDGLVTVDGIKAKRKQVLKGGEKLVIQVPPPVESKIIPEDIPLEIIFEDDFIIVVNKPAGMVTHPAVGHHSGTLVNALMFYTKNLSRAGGTDRAGIVHRLDKNTSGLILVAKDDKTQLYLQKELQERSVKRTYHALICGHVKDETGEIDLPIGRSLKDRKKMAVTNLKSRTAQTKYKLLERYRLYDYLEVNLQTGRTHQIRVHFSHLGHPVFGDPDYGGRVKWHRGIFSIDKAFAVKALDMMPRQALHAKSLEFTHPKSGEVVQVESDLPNDFKELLEFVKAE
ncbi:MAG: RluA family pseudouridine synthase [candidate division Zixibacteria bacterium]|nr:RluA family pseudouridine synthase [candidate division Zixibacteria bacterium]